MQEIFYRQLVSTDQDEYKRIRLDCLKQFPDNFGTTYEEELTINSSKLTNAIMTPDKNNFAFGACTTAGKLIGICGFVAETRLKTKHRGEIIQMFVDPVYAGKGIGKKLLQLSIDKAFENAVIEQIILSVVYSNEKAVKLYTGVGFIEYGRLDNYFKSGTKYFTQSFLSLQRHQEK